VPQELGYWNTLALVDFMEVGVRTQPKVSVGIATLNNTLLFLIIVAMVSGHIYDPSSVS
jgi:hypothetical protein